MPPLRVLVVDDNAALRENLAECLEGEGFEVFLAEDGPTALETLEREPRPDVVLLDLLLPGVGGREVAAAIRADPRNDRVRIVIITGLPPGPQTHETIAADAFLPKPFGVTQLLQAIREVTGERAA